jgi:hypothetical protein
MNKIETRVKVRVLQILLGEVEKDQSDLSIQGGGREGARIEIARIRSLIPQP